MMHDLPAQKKRDCRSTRQRRNGPLIFQDIANGIQETTTRQDNNDWLPRRGGRRKYQEQGERVLWSPQEGPQTATLFRQEFEIFYGGAKFSGKSYLGIGWLISGNQTVPIEKCTPIDISYVNCPQYRALAIRANLIDLESWIDEARRVYEPMGAQFKQNPDEFHFPSGAKIVLGHLDTSDAAYKYFGQVIHRVFVDELTFIPDF